MHLLFTKISMNKTVFYDKHTALGARMVEFADYLMPVEYSGVTNEHLAVRNQAGIFDVSHMGEIWVKGSKALEFLQHVTTNDVARLSVGQVQYSCLTNSLGGIVDDLLVYRVEEQKYMLVVNASNTNKDWQWLQANNPMGATLENSSANISQIALQGPLSIEILQKLTPVDVSKIPYYHFAIGTVAGKKDVILSATGYTGAGGFELYFYNTDGPALWDALMEAGTPLGLKPAGLAARDTLRLEKGFALYGNDLSDSTSPIEAGLGWIVKTEAKSFVGSEVIRKQKADGPARKLCGFRMLEKAIPRQHYLIEDVAGTIIGEVTSGTMSPSLKQGIGMGYVLTGHAAIGATIYIAIRNKKIPAEIVKLPFL